MTRTVTRQKKKSKREYNPRANPADFKFQLGMIFPSMEHFRFALKEEFIKVDREFQFVANDKTRVRAKCKGEGCMWTIYAKVQNSDNKTVRVNTLIDKHDCGIVFDNRLVTAPWLAKNFLEQFRLNPNMDYESFRNMTTTTKFSNVSKSVFYRAKKEARLILEGSVKDQYAILDDYCRQLTTTNPGKLVMNLIY